MTMVVTENHDNCEAKKDMTCVCKVPVTQNIIQRESWHTHSVKKWDVSYATSFDNVPSNCEDRQAPWSGALMQVQNDEEFRSF